MSSKNNPCGIVALREQAELVRHAARELGLSFEEESVLGREDAIRFVFGELDDETTRRLALSVPRRAYYFNAEIKGE